MRRDHLYLQDILEACDMIRTFPERISDIFNGNCTFKKICRVDLNWEVSTWIGDMRVET